MAVDNDSAVEKAPNSSAALDNGTPFWHSLGKLAALLTPPSFVLGIMVLVQQAWLPGLRPIEKLVFYAAGALLAAASVTGVGAWHSLRRFAASTTFGLLSVTALIVLTVLIEPVPGRGAGVTFLPSVDTPSPSQTAPPGSEAMVADAMYIRIASIRPVGDQDLVVLHVTNRRTVAVQATWDLNEVTVRDDAGQQYYVDSTPPQDGGDYDVRVDPESAADLRIYLNGHIAVSARSVTLSFVKFSGSKSVTVSYLMPR